MAIAVATMAGVHVLLRYTKLGKAMRATAANRTLARNCGIRTGRVITATWALTGALCGLAGTVFAIDATSFDSSSTDLFLVLILAAVFLGGPGQPYGAMLGALVIGLATEVSAAFIPADYKLRDRVRRAADHARRAPDRPARRAAMTRERDRA